MVSVVAHEPVRHRSLRRHRLDSGMTGQYGQCRIESRIGDTLHSHIAVVLSIGKNPFHSIIDIGGIIRNHIAPGIFLHHGPAFLSAEQRTDVLEIPLAQITSPYILIHNNITVCNIVHHITSETGPVRKPHILTFGAARGDSVRLERIRSPDEHHRAFPGSSGRLIHGSI